MSTSHSYPVKQEFYEFVKQFTKLRTGITNPYEENFFERILPLKKITNSNEITIYWVDKNTNTITSLQKTINSKEACSIPIDSKGPLPGVVAFFKYEYMIGDAEKYAKWYCNYIKLPELVNCILSFPILSQKTDNVIAVVELYRTCCYPYTDMDLQYVRELSKWIALSMEQNYDMQIQKNKYDIHYILTEILLDFLGGVMNYFTCLTLYMGYIKKSVNADQLFFYFATSHDSSGYADNCEMYTEEFNKKTKKSTLIKINAKIKFFDDNTFEYQMFRKKEIINEIINSENDTRIDSQLRCYIRKMVKSIVYIPIILKDVVGGIIVLINKSVQVCVDIYTDVEIELLKKIAVYLNLILHYVNIKKEVDVEESRYQILKETLIQQLLKKVEALDDIATNPVVSACFYEFSWAPQDNDNIISLTYFIFNNICPGLFVEETLKLFLSIVKKAYRDVPYHNFRLGFVYVHIMFCILHKIDDIFDINEKASLLLNSLLRYIDYNGLHNKIMEILGHPMTRLYDKLYHQYHSVELFEFIAEKTKLLSHLPKNDSEKIIKCTREDRLLVGATKNNNKDKLLQLLETNLLDFKDLQHRQCTRILLIWCTFHARHSLKLELSKKLNEELYREWYAQGDILVSLNKELPHTRFDRRSIDNLKEIELKHINEVLLPHYELLCRIYPALCEWKELLLFTKKAIELQIDLKHKKTWSIEQSLGRSFEDFV